MTMIDLWSRCSESIIRVTTLMETMPLQQEGDPCNVFGCFWAVYVEYSLQECLFDSIFSSTGVTMLYLCSFFSLFLCVG